MNYEITGKLVKEAREERGLSQPELAALLGYQGKYFISKIERGAACIPYDRVRDFAKALRISIGDIEEAYVKDSRKYFKTKAGIR